MGRIGVCVALGLVLAGVGGADDPEVARLKARVERLEAENKSLREALKGDADTRAEFTRLAHDIRMLHRLQAAMIEKPNDYVLKSDAADLARRIAPHSKGNRTVWQVLLDTKVLEDGMTVERAEELLGPRNREVARAARLVLQPEPSAPRRALPGGQDHGEGAGRLEADQPLSR